MKETNFDKSIRSQFEGAFGDMLLKVSTNYVDLLRIRDNHLSSVYGKSIDRSTILSDYMGKTPSISSIDDIEEVDEQFVRELMQKEDDYNTRVDRLQSINEAMPNVDQPWDEQSVLLLQEAVDLIGLTGKDEGLLNQIIDTNARFVEKPEQFRDLISALSMIVNETAKLYSSGLQLTFPSTNSLAMTQRKGRCFYRGENAYYKTSKAGCFRGKAWSEMKERGWDYVLWNLRMQECLNFFNNFDVVKNWNYSEVNYWALAQHYGLRTPLLDITTNLKTALFFACCKADANGLDWHPLTKKDFEKVDSRKDIAKLGGDSRYAILYYVPTDIVDCQWLTMNEKDTTGIITPIGYQPFMRCSTQYGYMMTTTENYDLMQDKLFRKVKFRLTENFCEWIYNEMNQGKAIYPNDDDIARIQDIVRVVSAMNHRIEFSRFTAERVRTEIVRSISTNPSAEIDPIYFYSYLNKNRIKIIDKLDLMSEKNIAKINQRYTIEKVESKLEVPMCNPIFSIG